MLFRNLVEFTKQDSSTITAACGLIIESYSWEYGHCTQNTQTGSAI